MNDDLLIYPLSETAITIGWGNHIDQNIHLQVQCLNHALHQTPFFGFQETVPAYATLTIFYRPELMPKESTSPFAWIKNHVEKLIREVSEGLPLSRKNLMEIPVCYDDEFGYDLDFIASAKGITKEAVIQMHQQNDYQVYMMGFLPGFAYMGTLDDTIATARKPTPRAKVEAGSVGIAGNQTGIYPLDSPGGWQIIGRTPYCLYDPEKQNPFLLKTGDTVRIYAISKEAFHQIRKANIPFIPVTQKDEAADLVIIKPGVYSTLQDSGRFGFRAYGVPQGGAMDVVAHHLANALVGNTPKAATIECTMGGMCLEFKKEALVAFTGGGTAYINGEKVGLYQPHAVVKNDLVEIRYSLQGIRAYLAVKGGFAAEQVMNSKSMSPVIGIGAPLKKAGELWFDKEVSTATPKIAEGLPLPAIVSDKSIRVFDGPEFEWLTAGSAQDFYSQPFTLSNRCDRMGYHLQAEPLSLSIPRELLSTAVTIGTVQLTPNGQLIVLMNDCQTTGGYPRVGQVAAVDLPLLAQLTPGETISFKRITFAEAEALYLLQQKAIHALFS